MSDPQSRIRNFCVIAHVDHGKTTLSDRLIELTGTVALRQMREQLLDSMELEREHGVTIKARAVRMAWTGAGGGFPGGAPLPDATQAIVVLAVYTRLLGGIAFWLFERRDVQGATGGG